MPYRAVVALIVFAAAFGAVRVQAGYASGPASTDPASSVGAKSAVLNGTVTTGSAESEWYFQYGTTKTYGKITPVTAIGKVPPTHVAATVAGLTPNTTYHFQLVVVQNVSNSNGSTTSLGGDLTFTTASGSATTGGATSISTSSAMLNGVAYISGSEQAGWYFQYGRTKAYDKIARGALLDPGLTAVSSAVKGLVPNVTYHYRLVVAQGSYQTTYYLGSDATFKTTKPGKLSLGSSRLAVRKGRIAIPIRCAGPKRASCKGKLSVIALGKAGKKVGCGAATLRLSAGKKKTLTPKVGASCLGLLRRARGHRHGATVRATFSTRQQPLKRRVTLVLKG